MVTSPLLERLGAAGFERVLARELDATAFEIAVARCSCPASNHIGSSGSPGATGLSGSTRRPGPKTAARSAESQPIATAAATPTRTAPVWALTGLGIRCVIGSNFGDIFVANGAQNGLLVVALAPVNVEHLVSLTASGEAITVDLMAQTVTASDGTTWAFVVPALTKQSLIEGLNDLELALRSSDIIAQWQENDRAQRPWVWASERR